MDTCDGWAWMSSVLAYAWKLSSRAFWCAAFWRRLAATVRTGEAHASWCVYNYAVIKLIYDVKTRDRVADNFYHLNGYFRSWFKLPATCILIRRARPDANTLDVQISTNWMRLEKKIASHMRLLSLVRERSTMWMHYRWEDFRVQLLCASFYRRRRGPKLKRISLTRKPQETKIFMRIVFCAS